MVANESQYKYATEAYQLLLEQFDAVTPADGSIFWNGINELALAKLVDQWNTDLGERGFWTVGGDHGRALRQQEIRMGGWPVQELLYRSIRPARARGAGPRHFGRALRSAPRLDFHGDGIAAHAQVDGRPD
jgi:hypothetical protein